MVNSDSSNNRGINVDGTVLPSNSGKTNRAPGVITSQKLNRSELMTVASYQNRLSIKLNKK